MSIQSIIYTKQNLSRVNPDLSRRAKFKKIYISWEQKTTTLTPMPKDLDDRRLWSLVFIGFLAKNKPLGHIVIWFNQRF